MRPASKEPAKRPFTLSLVTLPSLAETQMKFPSKARPLGSSPVSKVSTTLPCKFI